MVQMHPRLARRKHDTDAAALVQAVRSSNATAGLADSTMYSAGFSTSRLAGRLSLKEIDWRAKLRKKIDCNRSLNHGQGDDSPGAKRKARTRLVKRDTRQEKYERRDTMAFGFTSIRKGVSQTSFSRCPASSSDALTSK